LKPKIGDAVTDRDHSAAQHHRTIEIAMVPATPENFRARPCDRTFIAMQDATPSIRFS